MLLLLYVNSVENFYEGIMEFGSILLSDFIYINSQERFEVDEEGYMSLRVIL